MSNDTLILLRTSLLAAEIRSALVNDPALATLGLVDYGERAGIGGNTLSLAAQPWKEDDHDLIPNGFETATVTATIFPKGGPTRFDSEHSVIAAILRLVPGDVCLANQDAAGPNLLRLDEVVYIDPDWIGPESLTDFGYHPEHIVIGIPAADFEAAVE